MFASISKFFAAVKTAVAAQFAKRWVKVVGITGIVLVAVTGSALLFPAAAATVIGGVVAFGKSISGFVTGLFTKTGEAAVEATTEVGDAVAA